MPPVIIAAGITAASALAASKMGSNAQGKATDAQSKATADALAFQKQQEADRKASYNDSLARWTATRKMLFQHLGLDIGAAEPALAGGAGTGATAPTGVPAGVSPGPVAPVGASPGASPAAAGPEMASASPGFIPALQGLQGQTLGDLMQRRGA